MLHAVPGEGTLPPSGIFCYQAAVACHQQPCQQMFFLRTISARECLLDGGQLVLIELFLGDLVLAHPFLQS